MIITALIPEATALKANKACTVVILPHYILRTQVAKKLIRRFNTTVETDELLEMTMIIVPHSQSATDGALGVLANAGIRTERRYVSMKLINQTIERFRAEAPLSAEVG